MSPLRSAGRAVLGIGPAWWRGYRESCRDLPAPVWHLATVAFISRSGMMVMPFLVLYLSTQRGLSPTEAARVMAGVGLAGMLGQFVGGHLADRFGPRPVQLISLFGASALMLLAGQLTSTPALVVGLVALGFVSESFRPANAAAITAFTSAAERPRAYALQRLAVNFGVTFGPIIGGYLAVLDYAYLFWCNSAVLLASALLLSHFSRRWPAEVAASAASSGVEPIDRSPWRDPVLLAFLACVLPTAVVFMQFQTGLPLVLSERYHFDERTIGYVFAVNTVLIVLTEMPIWRHLAGRDTLVLVAIGALLTGLGFAGTGYGSTLGFAAASVCVWTLGEILHATSSFTFVAERAGPRYRGRYMGALGATMGLSVALGPLLCSWLYATGALWPVCAGLGVLSALIALALRAALRRGSQSERAGDQP